MSEPSRSPGLPYLATLAGWGRNPMCRRIDRLEWTCAISLVLLGLLFVPLAAAYGTSVQDSLARTASDVAARNHRATAVLSYDAPQAPSTNAAAPTALSPRVRATWLDPNHNRRSGFVAADYGARRGDAVTVWLDPSGKLTDPPRSPSDITTLAVFAGCFALLLLELMLMAVYGLLRHVLDRRRLAEWDVEWTRIEPTWRNGHAR